MMWRWIWGQDNRRFPQRVQKRFAGRRGGAGASGGEFREFGSAHEALYSTYSPDTPKNKPVALTFIPYYAWANREATPMQVWTPLLKV